MTTVTASEARANLYRLIDDAASSHEPILITGKRGNAVLLSEEDWSSIQETQGNRTDLAYENTKGC
ncbi:Antitoxin RelJ [Azoarcus sp. Aa7]|nr:Antitoxin RelJ [Azoarcus sp. Aa7]